MTGDDRWEIWVIDNNSTDQTAEVVRQYQADWPEAVPLYYGQERRPGAGFARKQAIERARGEWVAFLDDDNLPALDWVAQVLAFRDRSPAMGAFGGQVLGQFTTPLPPNFRRIQAYFAIVDRGSQPLCYYPSNGLLPPAAGLVVRRQAWRDAVPPEPLLSGRTAGRTRKTMLTSEDLEVLVYLQRAGWQIWYNPDLRLDHHIEPHRLDRAYLLPFMHGIGASRYVVRMLRLDPWQRPWATLVYWLNDLRRWLQHRWRYRHVLGQDLVADSEEALYQGYLAGPIELRDFFSPQTGLEPRPSRTVSSGL